MDKSQLQHFGLSDNESRVYLASLELGPSTVLKISQQTAIKRPTTYVAIEELTKLGLMSSFLKGKKRYFSAENPERLVDLLEGQKTELSQKEKSLNVLLPELTSLFSISGKRPQVRFFEGKEGIKSIRDDIVKSKVRETYEFTPLDKAYALFPPQAGDHREKLAKKLNRMRVIYTDSRGAVLPAKTSKLESRFVPEADFSFSTEVTIYGDRVAMVSLSETLIGVIIESQEIADTMRSIFLLAWEGAGRYTKEK